MAIIKLIDLISCSSQDKNYGAENLMFYHLKKPWLSSPSDTSRQIEAEFQLYKASQIDFIDIGNSGSSTFEVQVGRSSNPTNYITLLPAVTMLTLADLKEGMDKNSVYMFNLCNMVQDVAEQKWDRVKVICRQPYSKKFQFGLKFLLLRTKNDWEIHSNEDNEDLFVQEKCYYSAPLRDQCARQSDIPNKVVSRGQKLVEASKAQHSSTSKTWENEDSFKEDVRIFFIACCDEVFQGLSSEGCMDEFERQRQRKLCPKEKLIFQNVYLEFKVPFVAEKEKERSYSFFNVDENLSEKDSHSDLGVVESSSSDSTTESDCDIVSMSNSPMNTFKRDSPFKLNVNESKSSSSDSTTESDWDVVSMSNSPMNTFKRDSPFKLNVNESKISSSYVFNAKNTSDKLLILDKDAPQLKNVNSSSVKTISKYPVHPSVSSLRSQKNSSDISKTVRLHPKYRHKESTNVGSVSRSPKYSNVHSFKRHRENSSAAGSASKKSKTFEQFPTRTKEGYNRPEDFIQFDGSQPSTSKGFTLVDCPICLESFHPAAIEKHAATCGEYNDSDCQNDDSDCQMLTDTCPYCAAKFPSNEVDLHIENCFRFH